MKKEKAIDMIEEAIGALYIGFYNLRKCGEVQEEYDSMGSLISMLNKDRQFIREKYDIEY